MLLTAPKRFVLLRRRGSLQRYTHLDKLCLVLSELDVLEVLSEKGRHDYSSDENRCTEGMGHECAIDCRP
jgi:hypothetical protein